ncbi:hypothetical protein ACFLSS_03790 [Bacteroidota bacterium]
MKNMTIFLVILSLPLQLFAQGKDKGDIRGLTWGMSKQEVMDSEICEIFEPSPLYIGYFDVLKLDAVDELNCMNVALGNYTAHFLNYYFVLNEFFEFHYSFDGLDDYLENGKDTLEFLAQVDYYDDLLNTKYGKYKNIKTLSANLSYEKTWESKRNLIILDVNQGFDMEIYYISKKHKKLIEDSVKDLKDRKENPTRDL